MNWLRKLLGLCAHQWVTVNEIGIRNKKPNRPPAAVIYVQQCRHCGLLRQEQVEHI